MAGSRTKKVGTPLSQVFGERVRAARIRKGWTSQQQLADRLNVLGHAVDRSTIARLEAGKRGVSLDEACAIAAALEVSPLSLMLPLDPGEPIAVAPKLSASSQAVREWIRGDEPLPGQDRQFFEQESPEFWIEALGWRRMRRVYSLAGDLAQAWEDDDRKSVLGALAGLEAELERQRGELKPSRRTKGV